MFHIKSPLSERIPLLRARFYIFLSLIVLVFFWNSKVVFPVKLFVVFIHEFSHAFAAVVTGGKFVGFTYDFYEAGSSITTGGNKFLVLNAGYLGSSLFGGLVLLIACRTNWDRVLTSIIGIGIGLVTYYFATKETNLIFPYIVSAFAVISSVVLPNIICEAILIFVGLASCIYALNDIVLDIFMQSTSTISDAGMLSEYTGFPTIFWGAIWLLVAFVMGWNFLRWSVHGRVTDEQ